MTQEGDEPWRPLLPLIRLESLSLKKAPGHRIKAFFELEALPRIDRLVFKYDSDDVEDWTETRRRAHPLVMSSPSSRCSDV